MAEMFPPLSDEVLDALSAITAEDKEAAAAQWKADAPAVAKNLLEATDE